MIKRLNIVKLHPQIKNSFARNKDKGFLNKTNYMDTIKAQQ